MSLQAGFAEIDITPPVGTHKVGWLRVVTIRDILDPLFARAAVLSCDGEQIGFVQLDTLSVRWTTAELIRKRITKELGFPGQNVMVSATHNHAGPAIANIGKVKRDDAYVATMVDRAVQCFKQAMANQQPATAGFAHKSVFGLSSIRRTIQRSGIVKTHGRFTEPESLRSESVLDPELALLSLRASDGKVLGTLVNFACHPTQHGGDECASAGWPGVLASEMKKHDCPITLFLNGAAADVQCSDLTCGPNRSMEEMGAALATHVAELLGQTDERKTLNLSAASKTAELPHRDPTAEQISGTAIGAQRFIDPKLYDELMPALLERIKRQPMQPAQVQTLFADELAFVSMPAEYFSALGLRVKEQTYPHHTLIVGFANGMVGYVPTQEAFTRGGYETTFAGSSRLAPQAGDILADTAIEMVQAHQPATAETA